MHNNYTTDVTNVQLLLSLFAVSGLAGFIDAIAGGGGLITLPALLIAGIEPVSAIATNKLQSSSATISATVAFARKNLIDWKSCLPILILAFIWSGIGALSVGIISSKLLNTIAPILLILVAIYFALSPSINNEDKKSKISIYQFTFLVPFLGFYDGVFGPGIGSFFMVSFSSLLGFGIVKSMAHTKLSNAASNLGALLVFIFKGNIIFPIALSMAIGAFIGAQFGALCAVKLGSKLIKLLLIVICCLMAVKLLSNDNNLLRVFWLSWIYGGKRG